MFWFDSPTNRNTWNMTDTCPGDSTLNSKLWTSRSKGSCRKKKVQRGQKAPAALSEHRTALLDRCVWAETVSPGVNLQFEKIWSCFSEQKLICFNFIKNLLLLLLADQRPQAAHLLSNQAFNLMFYTKISEFLQYVSHHVQTARDHCSGLRFSIRKPETAGYV